jgi:HEAT repeat protein
METDERAICHLLKAMGSCRSAVALPVVENHLSHRSGEVRAAALDAAAACGGADPARVKQLLDDPEPNVVARAILALKDHAGFDAVRTIGELAEHPDLRFRENCVYAISELKDPRLKPVLARLSKDSSQQVARLAVEASRMLWG